MGEEVIRFEGLAHKAIPKAVQEQDYTILPYIPFAAVPLNEILIGSNIILNITVPAAVGAVMGIHSPADAARRLPRLEALFLPRFQGRASARRKWRCSRNG
jgi:hypothetical protein